MAISEIGHNAKQQLFGGTGVDAKVGSLTVAVGLVTAFLAYLWLYRWRQRNNIGPKTWPVLGSYLEVQANNHRLHDWVADYMKKSPTATFSTNVLGQLLVWIGRPDNVEYILKTNFANFPKGKVPGERMEQMLGHGIFNADGEVWKMQRKTASLEFSSKKLRDYSTAAYREHALRLLRILDNDATTQKQVDFQDLALRMTMDSISKIGFGVDFGALAADLPDIPFPRAFDAAAALSQNRQFGLTWKLKRFLNIGSEKQMRKEVAALDKYTYEIVKERRAQVEALEKAGKQLENIDLLSRFMLVKDDHGNLLTDKALRDTVLNFVIAGRDTSAVTLSWFVYCLSLSPGVVDKCNKELEEVIGAPAANETFEDFAAKLTFDSLAKLYYLHSAITETLRLFPAVPKDGKSTLHDCVLPDGTKIKAGSVVSYSPYGMGRLESLWGHDAEHYRPERWLKDGVFHQESPFKFASFQAGPRICLGKETAYIQMKMTAALLLRFFKIHLIPTQHVNYRMSLVMPIAGGLQVTLLRR